MYRILLNAPHRSVNQLVTDLAGRETDSLAFVQGKHHTRYEVKPIPKVLQLQLRKPEREEETPACCDDHHKVNRIPCRL